MTTSTNSAGTQNNNFTNTGIWEFLGTNFDVAATNIGQVDALHLNFGISLATTMNVGNISCAFSGSFLSFAVNSPSITLDGTAGTINLGNTNATNIVLGNDANNTQINVFGNLSFAGSGTSDGNFVWTVSSNTSAIFAVDANSVQIAENFATLLFFGNVGLSAEVFSQSWAHTTATYSLSGSTSLVFDAPLINIGTGTASNSGTVNIGISGAGHLLAHVNIQSNEFNVFSLDAITINANNDMHIYSNGGYLYLGVDSGQNVVIGSVGGGANSISLNSTVITLPNIPTATAGNIVYIDPSTYQIYASPPPSAPTGLTWSTVSGTSQTMAAGHAYINTNSALTTFTLPATAVVGAEFQIQGSGAGGWEIVYGSGQNIQVGNLSSTVTTGNIQSTNQYDVLRIVCTVANTTFNAEFSYGNLSVT